MKKFSILVKQVLMSTLTVATMSFAAAFTACSDDMDLQTAPVDPQTEEAETRAIKGKDYNINSDPKMDEDGITFNADNWSEHAHIYIYLGGNDYNQNIHDINGNKKIGYDIVALPWNNDESNTHLPMNFLDNFTPQAGWQLVMNRCGSNNIANNNFMVFYNKYSGMTRFFYYVPDGAGVNASDHAWEVMLSDNLAKHSTLRYGVPSDVQINKSAIGQNEAGYYTNMVTPWVNSLSQLGGAVVSNGWYAFDVDMSQYRSNPADNINLTRDKVQLQMKAWQTSRVNLYGNLTADIKGEFKMPVSASNNSIYGAFGDYIETGEGMYGKVMDFAGAMMKGDYWDGFRKGMDMIQEGANICGFSDENEKKNGQINMQMNGTIDMSGTMTTPLSAKGLCNPQMSIKLFDTQKTTFGQGIWNIKKNPVVYQLNAFYYKGSLDEARTIYATFFDPSSIEIELNPNAFDGQEIEWMKSQAVYVAREANGCNGTTDYINALNLAGGYKKPEVVKKGHSIANYQKEVLFNRENVYVYDAFNGQEDNQGLELTTFDEKKQGNGMGYRFMGRGNKKVILEPAYYEYFENAKYKKGGSYNYANALEVHVTLTVKLKGMSKPIVMSRVYVPELKMVDCADANGMNALYNKIKSGKKSNYNSAIFDQQLKYIETVLKWGKLD